MNSKSITVSFSQLKYEFEFSCIKSNVTNYKYDHWIITRLNLEIFRQKYFLPRYIFLENKRCLKLTQATFAHNMVGNIFRFYIFLSIWSFRNNILIPLKLEIYNRNTVYWYFFRFWWGLILDKTNYKSTEVNFFKYIKISPPC